MTMEHAHKITILMVGFTEHQSVVLVPPKPQKKLFRTVCPQSTLENYTNSKKPGHFVPGRAQKLKYYNYISYYILSRVVITETDLVFDTCGQLLNTPNTNEKIN